MPSISDYYRLLRDAPARADDVLTRLEQLLTNQEAMMHTLDELMTLEQSEAAKIDAVVAAIASLRQQIADLLAGTNLPPAIQAKVDALFDAATANAAKLDTAAGTTSTPPLPAA